MTKLAFLLLLPFHVLCEQYEKLNEGHSSETESPSLSLTDQSAAASHQFANEIDKQGRHSLNYHRNEGEYRFRRGAQDTAAYIEPPITWNYLRRYICGASNQKCMNDERYLTPSFFF